MDIGKSLQPYRLGTMYSTIHMWSPNKTLAERTSKLGLMYLASFGPLGSQMVTVQMDNNVYEEHWPIPVTDGGRPHISYGMDVFKDRSAVWFSPDGLWLAIAA